MIRPLSALLSVLALTAGTLSAGPSAAAPADRATASAATPEVWLPTGDFASSSFIRVARTAAAEPALRGGSTLAVEVPRGGRTSAQLAVRGAQTTGQAASAVDDLRVEVGRLQGPRGGLPASSVTVRYPEYIKDETTGGLTADPLRAVRSVDVPAGANQPVWFTVAVPAKAASGSYTAPVTLTSRSGRIGTYLLRVDVPDVKLREMADRPFTLDLWAHPDAVADERGLPLWSEQHWRALRPYLKDLAAHGQRVVDVAITQDPWMVSHEGQRRPQTWSSYNSTVAWRWDGTRFSFDFGVFDRYVRESFAAGVGPRIHAFSMLQFDERERFVYTDTRTGRLVTEEVDRGGARYAEGWGQFLRAFTVHLRERGWFDDARLAFDERPAATMQLVFDLLKTEAPEWSGKIAIAANSLGVEPVAQDISYEFTNLGNVPQDVIDRRRSEGKSTLFYTYFNPPRPNTVTASPPLSARMLGWVVAQRNLDGYLRWTYNSWPADVYADPTFRYGQGDEYIVYPGADGPVSSIRWELFRDGQDDAELLRLLQEKAGRDDSVFKAAIAAVDATADSTPGAWSAVLGSRHAVLNRLFGTGALTSDAVVRGSSTVAAGDPVTVDVTAVNTSSRQLADPSVTLDLPAGWNARLVSKVAPNPLPSKGTARWTYEVTVSERAIGAAWIHGRVTAGPRKHPEHTGIGAGLTVTSPIIVGTATAPTWSSPDGTAPVEIAVPVRNTSRSPRTASVTLSGNGRWQVDEPTVAVTVPAQDEGSARFRLEPGSHTGWTTVTLTATVDGVTVGSQRADLISGGRHVSDLAWAAESNGWGPAERDASNGEDAGGDGTQLTINGRGYVKGVGVHAPSRIALDLGGRCSRFQSDIGVDDEMPLANASTIRFRVLVDGVERHASAVLRASDPAQWVDVDVTGGRRLELVVDDGGNGIAQDHGNWAGAWLACTG